MSGTEGLKASDQLLEVFENSTQRRDQRDGQSAQSGGKEGLSYMHPAIELMMQSMPPDLARQLSGSLCPTVCAQCWLTVYRTFELNTIHSLLKDCI